MGFEWGKKKKIKELEDLSLLKLIPVEAKGVPKVRDNLRSSSTSNPCICLIIYILKPTIYGTVEAPVIVTVFLPNVGMHSNCA